MEDLATLRQKIDQIDKEILELFARRMEVTGQVGEFKLAHGMPVLDEAREREVLENKAKLAKPELRGEAVTLFETVMALSRRQQRRLVHEADGDFEYFLKQKAAARESISHPRVLFQGEPGAYAEEAVIQYFGEKNCERSKKPSWRDIFEALQAGEADYGVLPIENSSTGSINQVYDLLAQFGAFIVGEQVVKVDHCLAVKPGTELGEISDLYSHEQGFLQCEKFLEGHPGWTRHPQLNTAGAARLVSELPERGSAAICSEHAAHLYNLEILARHINENDQNYTRFVVVSPRLELGGQRDKISALFTLPHRAGTLHRIMAVFAVNGLNMMKLESRPIPGKSWEYLFFVDFSGNLEEEGMELILRELTQDAAQFRVLGNYKAAVTGR